MTEVDKQFTGVNGRCSKSNNENCFQKISVRDKISEVLLLKKPFSMWGTLTKKAQWKGVQIRMSRVKKHWSSRNQEVEPKS